MSFAADLCNAWADGWAGFMLAAVWQSTLFALVIAALAYVLRHASPAVRYWLWQIVAVKLLLMSLWKWPLPADWLVYDRPAAPASPVAAATSPNRPMDRTKPAQRPSASTATVESLDGSTLAQPPAPLGPFDVPSTNSLASETSSLVNRLSWIAWLMLAWCAVVAMQAALFVVQWRRLHKFLAKASPAPAEVVALVADYAARIGLRPVPRVVVAHEECPPLVCGLRRPTLVVPPSLRLLLPGDEAAPVLVHELAHLRRRDLWWNWLPQAARIVFWFHPVAHWVVFRTRLESELACDGWALTLTGYSAAGYADLIVRLVSHWSRPALLGAAAAVSAGLDGRTPISESEGPR